MSKFVLLFTLFALSLAFWLFVLLLLRFNGVGLFKFVGWDIGCKGEFAKFKDSPTFKVWYWVFPIFIVRVALFWFVALLFEFWPGCKIWLTILFVKFLISSEFTKFKILWKGLVFWLVWFWFWFWFALLLFSCIRLTSSSLRKTRWIIVSSLSTNLSKYSSSLNCFPLFKSLWRIGSILYISANFFFNSLIFMS